MKRALLFFYALGIVLAICAQSPQQDIKQNLNISGGCFYAYPGPQQQQLTPAPGNKKPFYISHFGRHGSRYPTKTEDFTFIIETLQRGEKDHMLTPLAP